jgi:hypothetical protein
LAGSVGIANGTVPGTNVSGCAVYRYNSPTTDALSGTWKFLGNTYSAAGVAIRIS